MARGYCRKCKCCLKSFAPTRVTAVTSATARLPTANEPARPPAKLAGSANPRTRATSATRGTSLASAPGGRANLGVPTAPGPHWLSFDANAHVFCVLPRPPRPNQMLNPGARPTRRRSNNAEKKHGLIWTA